MTNLTDTVNVNETDIEGKVNSLTNTVNTNETDIENKLSTHKISNDHDDRYYTETEVNNFLATKSNTTHLHDDRYYTETEVNNFLATKSDTSHTHDTRYFTETELQSTTDGSSGADKIGATEVAEGYGTTVQSNLEGLQSSIEDIVSGGLGSNTVTNTNLSTDVKVGSLATLKTTAKDSVTNAINEISDEIEINTPVNVLTTSALQAKLVSMQNDSVSGLPSIEVIGKTVVNLPGKDGNCEDVSKLYEIYHTTVSLDNTNKVFGSASYLVTATSDTVHYAKLNRYNILTSKYYCISAYMKPVVGQACLGVSLYGGNMQAYFQAAVDNTKFTRKIIKVNSNNNNEIEVACRLYDTAGNLQFIANGENANFDGIMVNEITEAEYNDANYEPPAYVDSVQHLRFPTIENQTTGETIVFPTALADGETIEYENGKAIVTETWMKDVALDGSLGWAYHTDGVGLKQVRVEGLCPNITDGTKIVTKYDGKILASTLHALDASDQVYNETGIGVGVNLYISIADTDSGWGEGYTPTDDEVDAYFYGWQMTVYGSNEPYNGTGTKQWNKLYCGVGTPYNSLYGLAQVVSGSYTTVVPTVMNDMGYTPYKLHYKFATPRISEIQPNGSISLAEGVNDVEIKSGYVLGEPANPLQYTSGSAYYLNHAGTGSYPQLEPTRLNNKLSNFKNIYKNGAIDTNNWIFSLNDVNAYGTTLAYCAVSNYDTTATYTVDYEILHEKYDCQAQDVTITSNGSLRDSLNTAIRNISSVQEDVGQIRNEELVYKVGSDEEGLRTEATFVYFSGIVSDGVGEITIIFKKAFKDIPKIYPNLNHFNPSLDVALGVRYVTTTSCVLYLYNKYPQTLVNATVAVKIEGV